MNNPLAAEDAPAKLNLALHVRRRMPDGYHALETLFAFTRFGDRVAAFPADDWRLDVTGAGAAMAGPDCDNLVLRAAHAFAAETGSAARYRLLLEKQIPVAAGLGGGSADAAATLRLLNRLAGAPLGVAALEAIGARLGADVPACVSCRTARGEGRGDVLLPGPALSGVPVLLVNPRVAVPTGPVFAGWDGVDRGPLEADWRAGRNDLTAPAIALQPVIAEVLNWLRTLSGATFAAMSGSGATCFALFEGGVVPAAATPHSWWSASTVLL